MIEAKRQPRRGHKRIYVPRFELHDEIEINQASCDHSEALKAAGVQFPEITREDLRWTKKRAAA
jgi:hypothetical protein